MSRTIVQSIDLQDIPSEAVSKYITRIDENGIWVTPENKKPSDVSTGAGATGTKIDGTGVGIYNAGIEVAKYGETTRIGKEDGTKVLITSSGDETYTEAGTYIIGKVNGNDAILSKFTRTNAVIGRNQEMVLNTTGMTLSSFGQNTITLCTNSALGAWEKSHKPQETIRDGESLVLEYFVGSEGINDPNFDIPFNIYYQMNGTKYSVTCNGLVGSESTDENGVTVKLRPKLNWVYSADVVIENNTGNEITMETFYADGNAFYEESPSIKVGGGEAILGRSISVGDKNESWHTYNSLFGYGLKAGNRVQTIVGAFNQQTTDRFIIGNGTSDDNRSNAFTVDWSGKVKCGDYSGVLRSILDIMHPIGSWYQTSLAPTINGHSYEADNLTPEDIAACGQTWFDPRVVWGGSWELLDQGIVLSSAGGTTSVPNGKTKTGGNNSIIYTPASADGNTGSHKLEASEIPQHNHGQKAPSGTFKIRGFGTSEGATSVTAASGIVTRGDTTGDVRGMANSGVNTGATLVTITATHTHDSFGGTNPVHSHTFTGKQATLDVRQNYKDAFMWHRTA